MISNNINNLVFFKFDGEHKGMRQACIFYKDGTVKMISVEEGIELSKKIADEKGLKSVGDFKEAFATLINKELIHVVSGKEFEKNFQKYRNTTAIKEVEPETNLMVIPPVVKEKEAPKKVERKKSARIKTTTIPKRISINNAKARPVEVEDDKVENYFRKVREKVENSKKTEKEKKKIPLVAKIASLVVALGVATSGLAYGLTKTSKTGKMFKKNLKTTEATVKDRNKELVKGNNDYYDNYTFEELQKVTQNKTQKAEMKRIHDVLYGYNIDFANAHIEEDKDIKAALTFDEIMALSQAYNDFTPKQIKAIYNGKAVKASDLDANYKTATLQLMGAHVIESKKHPVDMSGIIIDEEGKEFYNKYHKLFLNAKEATGDAKVAAVEKFYKEVRSDFPIDPDTREVGISHSDNHKTIESYKLAITPMVAAGEIMWQNLEIDNTLKGGVNKYFLDFADFEGINEKTAEKIVELLGEGKTMGEIDYFNDLGLCNIAEDKYEIIQQVTMGSFENVDKTNPKLEQYKNAMVKELTAKDSYFIDDAHRELSALDRFQKEVNWHFGLTEEGYYDGSVWYTTETHKVTRTWKTTKTTKKTVVTRENKPIPEDEKKKIDEKIEKENKKAKEKAEKEAEENRKKMQEEENKKAEDIKKEIEKEDKDLEEDIDKANDQIDDNHKDEDKSNDKSVNEEDFGDHNVDFDNDHSDNNGNLDDSVENITTDPTDSKDESSLPDPNETGKKFDEEGEKKSSATSESKSETKQESKSESKSETKQESKSESKSETKQESKSESKPEVKQESKPESKPAPKSSPAPKASPAPKKSNEKIVNDYVEDMAKSSDNDDDEKELTK